MRHFATSVTHTIYFGSLLLNYVLKLKSLLEYLAYSCVFEPEDIKLFEEFEFKISPLSIRILPYLEKSKINLNQIDDASSLDFKGMYCLSLDKQKRKDCDSPIAHWPFFYHAFLFIER